MIQKVLIVLALLFLFGACQKKEISILEDLNQKIQATNGDIEKAYQTMKEFLENHKDEMREAAKNFTESDMEAKRDRFLDFNRHFYNKNSLFETLDRYGYLQDPKFNALFDRFKTEMAVFFQEEF